MDTSIARPATYIDESIDNLTLAAVIGAILLVAALGALLFQWRAALIAAFAIPISLMAGVLVLDLRGRVDQPDGDRGLCDRRRRPRSTTP